MNIYQRVAQHALEQGEKTACHYQGDSLSYRQLVDRVDHLSMGLRSIGVESASHVALFCPNNLIYPLVLLAAAKLGAVVVPLPISLKANAIEKALKDSGCEFAIAWSTVAKAIIEQESLSLDKVINLSEPAMGERSFSELVNTREKYDGPVPSSELDYIFTLTSGSTGHPKPIVLNQATKIKRALGATASLYGLDHNEVVLVATPLYHSLAIRSLLMPLLLGATSIILPKFSVQTWLDAVARHKVSFAFAVSSQLKALAGYSVGVGEYASLRLVVSSSATLASEDKRQLLANWSCDLHECYGASELGVVSDFSLRDEFAPMISVGKPLPGVEVKIRDETGSELGADQVGEICCLSPYRFQEYFGQPEQTAKSHDNENYFRTGDLGYLDSHGYLYFSGRLKDIIKTGGISVYPGDIESAFMQLEGVTGCAALGYADGHFGEVILLVYEAAKEIDGRVLRQHALTRLTDYQQPRQFCYLETLPRTELGKILKPKISKQLGLE